jgi:acetyl-CoA carboxylase biotin carboxyl carrier protein
MNVTKTKAKAAGAARPDKTAAKKPAEAPKSAGAAAKSSAISGVAADVVRALASILDETALNEIEYETGGLRIRVARGTREVVSHHHAPAGALAAAPAAVAAVAAVETAKDPAQHPGAVKAPMVGVAYLQAEPGAPAFIKVGDSVTEGQTLVLIEAMKTFNPVKAPRAGRVSAILIENGSPVEYGEPLVIVE